MDAIHSKNRNIADIKIKDCWQYSTQKDCVAGTGNDGIVVSYGKHGLTERTKESKNSFVLFPKEWANE